MIHENFPLTSTIRKSVNLDCPDEVLSARLAVQQLDKARKCKDQEVAMEAVCQAMLGFQRIKFMSLLSEGKEWMRERRPSEFNDLLKRAISDLWTDRNSKPPQADEISRHLTGAGDFRYLADDANTGVGCSNVMVFDEVMPWEKFRDRCKNAKRSLRNEL